MEGGVALFLLLILAVVIGGIALFMYITGGALIGKTDADAGKGGEEARQTHERPTSPTQEKVEFAGTGRDDDEPGA